MDNIYREDPAKWPNGLHMSGFDGGVYMIREASTGTPVGFTGWQEKRANDGKKVGYYSIGILPEHRRNKFAKAAVSNLLRDKAANVDRVEALIADGNIPSIALADRLGVDVVMSPYVKQANKAKWLVGPGIAGFMDAITYGREGGWEEYKDQPVSFGRIANAFANVGLGSAAMVKGVSGPMRTALLSSVPMKDFAIQGTQSLPRMADAMQEAASNTQSQAPMSNASKLLMGLLAGGGALGAGYLAHKRNKATNRLADAAERQQGGRINLTLPTQAAGDVETNIDLPLDEIALSKNIRTKLQRDTRRRLREGGKERTRTRPKKDEEEEEDKVIELPKSAREEKLELFQRLLK